MFIVNSLSFLYKTFRIVEITVFSCYNYLKEKSLFLLNKRCLPWGWCLFLLLLWSFCILLLITYFYPFKMLCVDENANLQPSITACFSSYLLNSIQLSSKSSSISTCSSFNVLANNLYVSIVFCYIASFS